MVADPLTDGVEPRGRRRRAYTALALATVMSVIDGSIANVALPTIGRELHASPAATVWVVNAFSLAVTAALFAAASVAASRGLTRMWRVGIVTFTVGSLLCALSGTLALLIAARILQGVGAALIMAVSPALLRTVFPRTELGRAFGLNAMWVSCAAAAGPTAGGLLLAVAPWQWLFAINVPIAIAIIFIARGALPEVGGTGEALDLRSGVASAIGFSAMIYGLDGIARGDAPLTIALEIATGAAVFGWFVRRQFMIPKPTIALDLFRLPRFAFAAWCSFAAWAAWGIALVTLPFLLQLAYGLSPVVSGLVMTSWPIATAIVAAPAGRFADRSSVGAVASIGLTIFSVGLGAFALGSYEHVHPIVLAAIGAVCGAGFGTFQAPNNSEIMGSGPLEKSGSAAALLAVLRIGAQTLGAALVAVFFAVSETALGTHVPAAYLAIAAPLSFAVACAGGAIAALVSVQRLRRVG